jgi:hypothetical protein
MFPIWASSSTQSSAAADQLTRVIRRRLAVAVAAAAFPPQQPPCTTVGIRKRTRKDFPPSFSAPFFAESNSTPNHYIRIIFIAITRRTGAYALLLGPNAGTHTQSLLSSSAAQTQRDGRVVLGSFFLFLTK